MQRGHPTPGHVSPSLSGRVLSQCPKLPVPLSEAAGSLQQAACSSPLLHSLLAWEPRVPARHQSTARQKFSITQEGEWAELCMGILPPTPPPPGKLGGLGCESSAPSRWGFLPGLLSLEGQNKEPSPLLCSGPTPVLGGSAHVCPWEGRVRNLAPPPWSVHRGLSAAPSLRAALSQRLVRAGPLLSLAATRSRCAPREEHAAVL